MRTRQVSCPGGTLHTIAAGDTLYRLANRYNTTIGAIQQANPGLDPQRLQVGQQICIPVPPVPGPCPGGTIHTIAAGDTLAALARRYNTTVQAILDANPGLDPRSLQVGRRICIPALPPTPTPVPCPGGTLYTVRSGDTLNAIARSYNRTVSQLLAANPQITNPDVLTVGQRICIPALPPTPTPVPCPGGTLYTVRSGDTLNAIARRYNRTVSQLLAANPQITNPDVLTVGQRICIPGQPTPGPCPPGSTTHTIVAGDTLYSLARRYNTTVQAILDANPGLDPRSLQVGRRICIPVPPVPGPCPGGTIHTIVAGDTLYSLARRYNTTVDAILDANPGLDPRSLQVGRRICIPGR